MQKKLYKTKKEAQSLVEHLKSVRCGNARLIEVNSEDINEEHGYHVIMHEIPELGYAQYVMEEIDLSSYVNENVY